VGSWFARTTTDGFYGFRLKAVGGPVWENYNGNRVFHPSSTIKALYMAEALRQAANGPLNLTTELAHWPSTGFFRLGLDLPHPDSVQSEDAAGSGAVV